MRPIRTPQDVIDIFKACERGKHHLDRGLKDLLKLYERVYEGLWEAHDSPRAAIPWLTSGVDLNAPTDAEVEETFRRLKGAPPSIRSYGF